MSEQTNLMETHVSLYEFLKRRGVDMSWYDRAIANRQAGTLSRSGPVPLYDQKCDRFSIYLLKKDGTLWTIESDGKPYAQVRNTGKHIHRDTLICAHCKQQFGDLGEAIDHGGRI